MVYCFFLRHVVYSRSVKKIAWIVLGIIVFASLMVLGVSVLYRSALVATQSVEAYRKKFDERQNQAFIARSSSMMALNRLYGNGDKYVFRPPRVVPSFKKDGTIQGYTIYGMVSTWNPQSHLLTLSSYLGRPVSVRFDPDLDGSMAVVPKLDNYGVADSIGERDFVSTIRDNRYTELFCVGDIVSIESPSPQQFSYSARGTPIVPRIIQLSFRLCDK